MADPRHKGVNVNCQFVVIKCKVQPVKNKKALF